MAREVSLEVVSAGCTIRRMSGQQQGHAVQRLLLLTGFNLSRGRRHHLAYEFWVSICSTHYNVEVTYVSELVSDTGKCRPEGWGRDLSELNGNLPAVD